MPAALAIPTRAATLVPKGWAEEVAIPWADSQTNVETIIVANAELDARIAAYQTLKTDSLELVKARRYLELRLGELLESKKPGPKPKNSSVTTDEFIDRTTRTDFRKLAEHKKEVVEILTKATTTTAVSRRAILTKVEPTPTPVEPVVDIDALEDEDLLASPINPCKFCGREVELAIRGDETYYRAANWAWFKHKVSTGGGVRANYPRDIQWGDLYAHDVCLQNHLDNKKEN